MQGLEHIAALLHIEEKTREHGSALTNIRMEAWKELLDINAQLAPEQVGGQAHVSLQGEAEPGEEPLPEPDTAPPEKEPAPAAEPNTVQRRL